MTPAEERTAIANAYLGGCCAAAYARAESLGELLGQPIWRKPLASRIDKLAMLVVLHTAAAGREVGGE